MMKSVKSVLLPLLLSLVLLLSLTACGTATAGKTTAASTTTTTASDVLWDNATYKENTPLGTGSTTFTLQVKVNSHTVDLTIKTDKKTVGDALLELKVIAGESGDYGLYIKQVNGITADYDTDKAYWAFYQNGSYMNTGVDTTAITDGAHYELVYTK